MARFMELGLSVAVLCALGGCGPDYSPNTYASAATQQANKVDRGVVVGFREVAISADGTVGAVVGGAAGGLVGSQAPGGGFTAALGALGGSVIGGIVGTTMEHTTEDTRAFEYIVRQPNGDLISVTQKDKSPLAIGQAVLVIAGKQARVVPDYTVSVGPPVMPPPPAKHADTDKPAPPVVVAPLPEPTGAAAPTGAVPSPGPTGVPTPAAPPGGVPQLTGIAIPATPTGAVPPSTWTTPPSPSPSPSPWPLTEPPPPVVRPPAPPAGTPTPAAEAGPQDPRSP